MIVSEGDLDIINSLNDIVKSQSYLLNNRIKYNSDISYVPYNSNNNYYYCNKKSFIADNCPYKYIKQLNTNV